MLPDSPFSVNRGVTFVKSSADAYRAYVNLIKSAGKDLMLLIPVSAKQEGVRTPLQLLEKTTKRGVQVRVLTPTTNKKLEHVDKATWQRRSAVV